VGTYILIFAGCGAALVNEKLPITVVGIAVVSGLALTVAIYSVGHVSGAHFNPAVTIALAVVRKIHFKLVSSLLGFGSSTADVIQLCNNIVTQSHGS
jgi:aquaporin NIP